MTLSVSQPQPASLLSSDRHNRHQPLAAGDGRFRMRSPSPSPNSLPPTVASTPAAARRLPKPASVLETSWSRPRCGEAPRFNQPLAALQALPAPPSGTRSALRAPARRGPQRDFAALSAELQRRYDLPDANVGLLFRYLLGLAKASEPASALWNCCHELYLQAAKEAQRGGDTVDLGMSHRADDSVEILEDLRSILEHAHEREQQSFVAMVYQLPWPKFTCGQRVTIHRLFSLVPATYRAPVLARLRATYAGGTVPPLPPRRGTSEPRAEPVLAVHLAIIEAYSVAVADCALGRTPALGEKPALEPLELRHLLRTKCMRASLRALLRAQPGAVDVSLLRTLNFFAPQLRLPDKAGRKLVQEALEAPGFPNFGFISVADQVVALLASDYTATPLVAAELLSSVLMLVEGHNVNLLLKLWPKLLGKQRHLAAVTDFDWSVQRRALILVGVMTLCVDAGTTGRVADAIEQHCNFADFAQALSRLELLTGLPHRNLTALAQDKARKQLRGIAFDDITRQRLPPSLMRSIVTARSFTRAAGVLAKKSTHAAMRHLLATLAAHQRLADHTSDAHPLSVALRAHPQALPNLRRFWPASSGASDPDQAPRWRHNHADIERFLALLWRRLRLLLRVSNHQMRGTTSFARSTAMATSVFVEHLACLDENFIHALDVHSDFLDGMATLWANTRVLQRWALSTPGAQGPVAER